MLHARQWYVNKKQDLGDQCIAECPVILCSVVTGSDMTGAKYPALLNLRTAGMRFRGRP